MEDGRIGCRKRLDRLSVTTNFYAITQSIKLHGASRTNQPWIVIELWAKREPDQPEGWSPALAAGQNCPHRPLLHLDKMYMSPYRTARKCNWDK